MLKTIFGYLFGGYGVRLKIRKKTDLANEGDHQAQFELGMIYSDNTLSVYSPREAFKYLSAASLAGHVDATAVLGDALRIGGLELERNLDKSFTLLSMAAEHDSIFAQIALGKLFLNEDFSQYDPKKARECFEHLANAGDPVAQQWMGYIFLYGLGLESDNEKALAWLRASAKAGNKDAVSLLAECYYRGYGVQVSRMLSGSLFQLSGDDHARKLALAESPLSHISISGYLYRKLKKSKDFLGDLDRLSMEVGLYERNQFISHSAKNPIDELLRGAEFDYPGHEVEDCNPLEE